MCFDWGKSERKGRPESSQVKDRIKHQQRNDRKQRVKEQFVEMIVSSKTNNNLGPDWLLICWILIWQSARVFSACYFKNVHFEPQLPQVSVKNNVSFNTTSGD